MGAQCQGVVRNRISSIKWVGLLCSGMPKMGCPDCGRDVAMHELDTQTVARRNGFQTTYRCPFCRANFEDVTELL